MSSAKTPSDPEIFHITHLSNLAAIIAEGGLWCDRQRLERAIKATNIAHRHIKQRRLTRTVDTKAGGVLGDYVPFNFCPRSVMLYPVSCGHPDYQGGQEQVIHLVSRISIACGLGRPWAFTDRHAELAHALHYDDLARLREVPWHVMALTYWAEVKEEKQAEFLVHDFFEWSAVTAIGVMTASIAQRVDSILATSPHKPLVSVRPQWYY